MHRHTLLVVINKKYGFRSKHVLAPSPPGTVVSLKAVYSNELFSIASSYPKSRTDFSQKLGFA